MEQRAAELERDEGVGVGEEVRVVRVVERLLEVRPRAQRAEQQRDQLRVAQRRQMAVTRHVATRLHTAALHPTRTRRSPRSGPQTTCVAMLPSMPPKSPLNTPPKSAKSAKSPSTTCAGESRSGEDME